MADVVVNTETNNPKELLGQGIRAYVLQDYNSAVAALSKASELMAAEYGDDLHDSLGDVYLYYGKALLGLSREESEPLGDAVPKNNEEDSDDDEVENTETEEGDSKEDGDKKNNGDAESSEAKDNEAENIEEGASNGTTADAAGSAAADTTEEQADDEEPTDLQVAWEVLELAKKIYEKHGDNGRKNLAETLIVLGEISLESENFDAAINDIKDGLEIQKSLFGKDSRTLAETYYKLGVAYSTNSQIEDAIKSFNESLQYLNNRIATLEKVEDKKDEMEEEVREIKALIPDIEEKIADMKTYKDEALRKLVSAVTEAKPSDGASSSTSSSTPANNISHLVKRKRKLDEVAEDKEAKESPAKRPPT